jgi:hypothetical protein
MDRSELSIEHHHWYCSPLPFSCRFLFGCKELPCEVKLYNKRLPDRQPFSAS